MMAHRVLFVLSNRKLRHVGSAGDEALIECRCGLRFTVRYYQNGMIGPTVRCHRCGRHAHADVVRNRPATEIAELYIHHDVVAEIEAQMAGAT
jgi:hypothetical protein